MCVCRGVCEQPVFGLLNVRFFVFDEMLNPGLLAVDQLVDSRRKFLDPIGIIVDCIAEPHAFFLGIEAPHPDEDALVALAVPQGTMPRATPNGITSSSNTFSHAFCLSRRTLYSRSSNDAIWCSLPGSLLNV